MLDTLSLFPPSILVIVCAIFIERILPTTSAYSPMLFFKAMGLGISSKVHPKGRQSKPNTQITAGLLAIIVILAPFIFTLVMLMQVVEFPYLIDLFLVIICLQTTGPRKAAKDMSKAIAQNNKSLAKARISPWVLRDTSTLSPMGMRKTALEMLLLRASKEVFTVIFFYLCFGAVTVFVYRILTMLAQSWNSKIKHFEHFGKPCQLMCYYLEWLPSRALAFTIMALGQFKLSYNLMARAKFEAKNQAKSLNRQGINDNSLFILAATAGALKVSLGGPAIYEGNKIRKPVIGSQYTEQPQSHHLIEAGKLIDKALVVWLLVIILISIFGLAL